MTEAQFRAYLFDMHLRGESVDRDMGAWAPPPPKQSFEDRRMEASRQWMRSYHGR